MNSFAILYFWIWIIYSTPSKQPSTSHPTPAEDCPTFLVGPPECFEVINQDIVAVIDSSSSISPEEFAGMTASKKRIHGWFFFEMSDALEPASFG